MEGKDKEKVIEGELIAPNGGQAVSVLENQGSMLSEKYVENAGKQIELRSKLLMTGLKAVKPHDFQDFEGKPYLEGEGAARIMAVVRGFKVGVPTFTVDQIAPHYFVECAIPMEFMGATTVAIGDCSTADPFFCGKDGKGGQYGRHLARTGSEAMATRLILGDAKKKCRENAISRGVSELLGIKGLTWGDLAALGFTKSGAGSSVQFKSGSEGAEVKTVTPSDAEKAAKGSVINIKGKCTDALTRTFQKRDKTTGTATDYTITDGTTTIKVTAWGGCIDPLKKDDILFAEEVTVGEYQGTRQYVAKTLSAVDGQAAPAGNAEAGK